MTTTTRKAITMRYMVRFTVALAAIVCAATPAAFAQNAAKGVDHPSSATEDECIAVLESDAGWQPKYEACTRLRQVGAEKSVPVLASLLKDEKLSHMARYALEPMPYPEASDALRNALGKTKGQQKLGVITALGVKRDQKSIKAIAKSLRDKDPGVARAAAGALGRIGTPQANLALSKFAVSAPDELKDAVAEAQLAGAETLVRDNKGNLAVPYYAALLKDERESVRLGAFRGLTKADPEGALALLAKTLAGDDELTRNFAAQIVAEIPGADQTKRLADALPALPPAGQAAMLRGLGDRGDSAAHDAVVAALASSDTQVKAAAATALGPLGTDADVPALVAMLSSGDAELAAAARSALGNVENKKYDEALAAAAASATGATRASLVELLSDRMTALAASIAVAALSDGDAAVRASALRSLTKLGGPEQAPAVITVLKTTGDESERGEAANALNAIAAVRGEEVLAPVLDALQGASAEVRIALLRNLQIIGSAQALEPVVAALRDGNADVSGAAVRVLSEWKTTDAAPHLLKLAQSANAAQKDTALRGYVRLAQAEPNADAKAEMLANAMGIAKSKEEKWLVLPAYGTLATKPSLDLLASKLDDPEIKNEAGSALVAAATAFAKADAANKTAAAEAVNAVLAKCDDETLKERAQKALEGMK